jgi:hypothetical protein
VKHYKQQCSRNTCNSETQQTALKRANMTKIRIIDLISKHFQMENIGLDVRVMVFDATFNNISVILLYWWRKKRVPPENH